MIIKKRNILSYYNGKTILFIRETIKLAIAITEKRRQNKQKVIIINGVYNLNYF